MLFVDSVFPNGLILCFQFDAACGFLMFVNSALPKVMYKNRNRISHFLKIFGSICRFGFFLHEHWATLAQRLLHVEIVQIATNEMEIAWINFNSWNVLRISEFIVEKKFAHVCDATKIDSLICR